jgi:gamma-glutamyl:cysteine ligase YbdK (ATP-grasp superfamily)
MAESSQHVLHRKVGMIRKITGVRMFTFGIEHEVAFTHKSGQFADYLTTSFAEFDTIIARLPMYEQDYPYLRIGDAGIRKKRWYIEGLERFTLSGVLTNHLSKGIEIRTTPHSTITGAVDELTTSFHLLCKKAGEAGFFPVLTSFHPYRTKFIADPPFNAFEEIMLSASPEDRTSMLALLTYGPDLNISVQGLEADNIIDSGRKMTYYSPYIVPFSYSSPFFDGGLWDGLSVRTYMRTGVRPATQVFLAQPSELLKSNPSLTKLARTPFEVGRIEFKACDSCKDFAIYAGLLALLKGLLLDTTLKGRATTPARELHQISALQGFANNEIAETTRSVLQAAKRALATDEDACLLEPFERMLEQRTTPAHCMIHAFQTAGSIEDVLRQTYASFRPEYIS